MSQEDALDAAAIRSGLAAHGEALPVEVVARCASTNSDLLSRIAPPASLLFAEEQTAGRGRRGRRWQAAAGSALLMSLRWEFARDPGRLRGLSLAAGVAVAHALRDLGARGVTLKWPNDLLAHMEHGGAKLGGLLIETRPGDGCIAAVIGVGINCHPSAGLESRLGRRVAALAELIDPMPARNQVAARVAAGLAQAMREFAACGFEAFRTQWQALHAHQGAPLRVRMGDGRVVAGIADGVAPDGGLLVRNRRGVRCIHSGTVIRETARRGAT